MLVAVVRSKEESEGAVSNPFSPLLASSVLCILLAAKGRCLRQENYHENCSATPTLSGNIGSWWDVLFLPFSHSLKEWIYAFRWVLLQVKKWLNTDFMSPLELQQLYQSCTQTYLLSYMWQMKMNCKALPINCRVCPSIQHGLLCVPVSGDGDINMLTQY